MAKITINLASVKVMRSHDYCHFEVNLTASVDCPSDSPEWFQQVDSMRKNAARLADKAVEQYKVAKSEFTRRDCEVEHLEYKAQQAELTPEDMRTSEEKAAIKALADARFEQRHYDYQDDWDDQDS
jgi:hypothetical protein